MKFHITRNKENIQKAFGDWEKQATGKCLNTPIMSTCLKQNKNMGDNGDKTSKFQMNIIFKIAKLIIKCDERIFRQARIKTKLFMYLQNYWKMCPIKTMRKTNS